jgi:hypothetical protein
MAITNRARVRRAPQNRAECRFRRAPASAAATRCSVVSQRYAHAQQVIRTDVLEQSCGNNRTSHYRQKARAQAPVRAALTCVAELCASTRVNAMEM